MALLVTLVVGAGREVALGLRYPVAAGIDGYYYVLQTDHFLSTGNLYFATAHRLPIYLLAALTTLTHNSVTSVKLIGVLLNVLLALGIFLIVTRVVRDSWAGALGSVLTLAPQSHFFMSTEYINNLAGIVFLLFSGCCFICVVQTNQRRWLAPALIFLVASLFSHRSIIFIVVTFASCSLMLHWLTRRGRWPLIALLGVAVIWFGPALLSHQPFFTLPHWLKTEISGRPQWPLTAPVIPEELLLAVSSILLLFLIGKRLRNAPVAIFDYVFGSLALWSLIVTLNPFLNSGTMLTGIAGRLRVLAYMQAALIVPALVWLACQVRRKLAIYVMAACLPLVFMSIAAPLPYGLQPSFLVRREQLIRALRLHQAELAPGSLVIARHGDQFAVTATVGVPAQRSPITNAEGRTIYWLLDEVSDRELSKQSVVLMDNGDTATVLAEDSVLRSRLLEMSDTDRRRLLQANVTLAGMVYLPG